MSRCSTFSTAPEQGAGDLCGDVVRVSTIQGIKGLEFSRVFMCGLDDIWQGHDDDTESQRRIAYAGMTRGWTS